MKDLKDLNKIKVPRCFLGQISESDNISLHIFCDASKVAYATVIFIRVESIEGVKVHFVKRKRELRPQGRVQTREQAHRV